MPSFSTDTSDLLPPSIPLKDRYNFNKNLPTFPPPEVLRKIFGYLNVRTLLASRFVCPSWNDVSCKVLARRERCIWKFKGYLVNNGPAPSSRFADIGAMIGLPIEFVKEMETLHQANDKSTQTDPEILEEALISNSKNKSLFSSWSVAATDLMEFHKFISHCEMFPHLESLVIGGSVVLILDFICTALDNGYSSSRSDLRWTLFNLRKLVVWGEPPTESEIKGVTTTLENEEVASVVGFGNLICPGTLTSLQLGGDICVDHPNFCLHFINGCSNLQSLILSPSLRSQADVVKVERIFRGLLDLARITSKLTEFGWWFRKDLDGDKTWPELLRLVYQLEFSHRLKSLRIGSSRMETGSDVLFQLLDLNSVSLQSLVFFGDVQSYAGKVPKKSKKLHNKEKRVRRRSSTEAGSFVSYDEPDYLKSGYTGNYVTALTPEQLRQARQNITEFSDCVEQAAESSRVNPIDQQVVELDDEFQKMILEAGPTPGNSSIMHPSYRTLLFETFPNLRNVKFLKIDSNRGYAMDIFRLVGACRNISVLDIKNPKIYHFGFPIPYFPTCSAIMERHPRHLKTFKMIGQNISDFATLDAIMTSFPCLTELELKLGLDDSGPFPSIVINSLAPVTYRLKTGLPKLKVLDLHYTFPVRGPDFLDAMKDLAGLQYLKKLSMTWRLWRLGSEVRVGLESFANSQCQLIVYWDQFPDPEVVNVYRRLATKDNIKLQIRSFLNDRN